ncbi:hypothetical protein E2C01_074541 [Portunus trituberculatus]|uniref:Uncharacterized protein n=1 Tax=Portunus trituberculatus TaxID=210409 RepID=A0A5B7I3K9_PORTR|nr:hypothetical protein [Portunus trituberculatus]
MDGLFNVCIFPVDICSVSCGVDGPACSRGPPGLKVAPLSGVEGRGRQWRGEEGSGEEGSCRLRPGWVMCETDS